MTIIFKEDVVHLKELLSLRTFLFSRFFYCTVKGVNRTMLNNLSDTLILKFDNLTPKGVLPRMTDKEFLEKEIQKWEYSPERLMQIKGFLYYQNEHDILKRERTMIGEDGKLEIVDNLPNNKIIDNQYLKMVNQKANYLFGKPVTFGRG